ncbi:uncharacterized protein C8Q71DRAFT_545627 [Rhodofomes roseus]|uniref:Zinc finger protein 830 n=1 Tax=Rhodofomes roseus TaxID=34475 RepID=A0ABQ8KKY8_9APHY|nr:uncharacterized protein C8Q71DRAFT_545627 [Rhodofomes roseus]KAH9838775.1 hypothetical protein C8Q71DRAFT_545627 [Rhodofomes roseus]
MSDARSLLRAKRQEVRVNHPLASYSASGQLRCIACGLNIKQGTSWEGHIGSKQHRTSAARLREEEQRRAQEELLRQKRKASEEPSDGEDEGVEAKRRRVDEEEEDAQQLPPAAQGDFPTDFFSDPSRAPPPPSEDTDDEDAPDGASGAPAAPASRSAIDEEWERFQAAVVNAPDIRETYEQATIFAEPVLAPEVPEGFPPQTTEDAQDGQDAVVDEGAIRRRKEQDEKELIMDRLLEEERVQEEADAKVSLLKARLEAVKRQREARKATKAFRGGQT